jgi:hypothetical protein
VPVKETVSFVDHLIFAFFEFFANHFIISFDYQKKKINNAFKNISRNSLLHKN